MDERQSPTYGRHSRTKCIEGDCLEVMRGISDKSVDLICSDPPYGMSYQSAWRTATPQYDKIENDTSLEWLAPVLKEAFRVLKDDTHIYLFCNDYAISDFRKEMEAVGFIPKRTLVWVKNNHTSGDLNGDYGNKTEFILYAQKGRRFLNGNRDTNVIEESREASELHPTQKPVNLMMFLIEKSSNEGELVLDPFAGSGTTLIAAKQLNRNAIGIEIAPQYAKIAQQRLDAQANPLF